MNIKEFLAQLKWDPFFQEELNFIHIIYLHRGAPSDQKIIKFSQIKEISGNFMILEENEGEISQIPIHRIQSIMNIRTNQVYFHNVSAKKNEFDIP